MVRGALFAVGVALAGSVVAGGCKAAIGDAPGSRGGGGGGGADGGGGGGGGDAPAATDGMQAIDAPAIDAALGMFGTPAVTVLGTPQNGEDDPVLTSDGLQIIFAISTAANGKDFYLATRATTADAFGTPTAIASLNTKTNEESPRLSADDLTLYYASNEDIYMATRTSTAAAFGSGAPISYVNTTAYEKWFDVCPSGYYLVSRDNGATGQDFFEGHLGSATTGAVTALNSPGSEISAFLTLDCNTVYFASTRTAAGTAVNIYTSTRTSEADPWSAPVEVTEFGTSSDDEDLFITKNGRIAVFASTRDMANKQLFFSTR